MEPEQARGRNTDPAPSLDQDQDQHVMVARDQGAIRSYECVFCKRGFTNAQALGGHMNIHRKEKARLKQASSDFDETQPAMEVSKMPSSYSPTPLSDFLPSESKSPNPAWISAAEIRGSKRDETTLVEEGLHLPLFTETPSSFDKNTGLHLHGMLDHGTARPADSSTGSEIDLELRLGPEPKDTSAGTTSTRQFF